MKRALFVIGAVLIVGIIGAAAYVLRPSEQASAPIQATPLPTQAEAAMPTKEAATPTEASAPTQASEPTAMPSPTDSSAQPGEATGLKGSVTYQIVQEESQVRFSIYEVLRGSPFTAVGATDQVAGEIAIDFDNATAQLGVVQVNARTLKTDNSFRDRAINNEILDTAEYEFITFTPTAINGLPQSMAIGETVTFQITGDLTIRNITKPVTFEVSVTLVSPERLEGYASATVLRSDYNLTIPSVPSVADVSDDVLLEIEFTATAK